MSRFMKRVNPKNTHLITDPLPTILALHRALDDFIAAAGLVGLRDDVQREADDEEVDDFVEEGPKIFGQRTYNAPLFGFVACSRDDALRPSHTCCLPFGSPSIYPPRPAPPTSIMSSQKRGKKEKEPMPKNNKLPERRRRKLTHKPTQAPHRHSPA